MKYPQLVSMPSAVSDWLEEQLEARGIDAVVYTRYVLSLLHTHTIDVIYPDEDLQFSRLRKEVGRSAGSRKRFRRTSDWWRHAQADAEQIKRSAAVECLMSASDQNCEIESLVDELCEKLKEVNSPTKSSATTSEEPPKQKKISPQELAEKYYAAFPPLCPNDNSLVNFIPKWIPTSSPKKNKRKHKRQTYDNRFYSEMMKQRPPQANKMFGLKKENCVRNLSKEMTDNLNNWEFLSFTKKTNDNLDQCVDVRDEDDEEMNMYEDLPVDISVLLDDSPHPQDETVEMMNLANMRDTGKKGFISCGTNIISSIWSNNDQNKLDGETMLDLKFGSISIDTGTNWPDFEKQNATNNLLEKKNSVFEIFHSLPTAWSKNDFEMPYENDHLFDRLTVSLMKLNHCKEKSCFKEIIPRTKTTSQPFNPFSQTANLFCFNRRSLMFEKDDLLTSERSHFRPINEKTQKDYEDGATFLISNNLDKVEYKRSESGSMYLENEFGLNKKYREFKESEASFRVDFVLKFCVIQNDKACQTEDISNIIHNGVEIVADKVTIADSRSDEDKETVCRCPIKEDCLLHPNRPESSLGEVTWKYEMKTCDKCNNNNVTWDTDWLQREKFGSEWDNDNLKNIWDGGKVCQACLRLNGGRTPPSVQHTQLREDISQDGEQLLSDLSSLQKCYMESLPASELTYDLMPFEERKRRHSFMDNEPDNGIWSFASRLEEDCLITMSTLPTLRSVTL